MVQIKIPNNRDAIFDFQVFYFRIYLDLGC